MKITKKSMFTGEVHTLDLNITQEQLDRYNRGEGHVQTIFPHLTPSEREFLMTGCTAKEWDDMFKEENESDDDDNESKEMPGTVDSAGFTYEEDVKPPVETDAFIESLVDQIKDKKVEDIEQYEVEDGPYSDEPDWDNIAKRQADEQYYADADQPTGGE